MLLERGEEAGWGSPGGEDDEFVVFEGWVVVDFFSKGGEFDECHVDVGAAVVGVDVGVDVDVDVDVRVVLDRVTDDVESETEWICLCLRLQTGSC